MKDVLYHYCSTSTFVSIITNSTLRLSSLSLSNDSMEGRWVLKVFEELLDQAKIFDSKRAALLTEVEDLANFFDGSGFCLSEEGDMLSQWRGYADDAHGFAIGFSTEYLTKLCQEQEAPIRPHLHQVIYDNEEQRQLVQPMFKAALESVKDGAHMRPVVNLLTIGIIGVETEADEEERRRKYSRFLKQISSLVPYLYRLKNPAFKEEREWRIVNSNPFPPGIAFRASRDRVIPYIDLSMTADKANAIVEIIKGPKNITPDITLKRMLEQTGFKCTIRASSATYR